MHELLTPDHCSHGFKTMETYDLLHVALVGPHLDSISPLLQLLKYKGVKSLIISLKLSYFLMSPTDLLYLYHDSKEMEVILEFSIADGCYMRVSMFKCHDHFKVQDQGHRYTKVFLQ